MTSRCCGVWARSCAACCSLRCPTTSTPPSPTSRPLCTRRPSYTPGTGNDWAVWTASGQTPLALSYYQNNQILEYGPTTPGDPVYFAVQSGWSRLRITQETTPPGTDQALKINLGDQNVSNVFARSTIVQVRNQSTRLVLQKTGHRGAGRGDPALCLHHRPAGTPPARP